MSWSDFVQRWVRPVPQVRPARKYRLLLELLEERATPAAFAFTTYPNGAPGSDGQIGTASTAAPNPNAANSPTNVEIESADDFTLAADTSIDTVTFVGLVPTGAGATPAAILNGISDINLEVYRTFPQDSTNPPNGAVPTRTNSPADVQLDNRDFPTAATLGAATTLQVLNPAFTVQRSIVNNVKVGGPSEGPVTGQEVLFTVKLPDPFVLAQTVVGTAGAPDTNHYFLIPQVRLATGNFLWLSAPKPNANTNTGTAPGAADLQSWMRNDPNVDPNWLRIGTDIIGGNPAPTFNAAFSLSGQTVTSTLTSISPSTLPAGSGDTIVTINGTNFTPGGNDGTPNSTGGSTVLINGTAVVATYTSSSQLSATVPASLLTGAGAQSVVVQDTGGTTAPVTLTVTAPTIASITPTSATAGSGNTTLNVTGSNFVQGAKVLFNGTPLTTTFINGQQLSATIPSSLLASATTAKITVAQANATSNAATFNVVATITTPTPTPTPTPTSTMSSPSVTASAKIKGAVAQVSGQFRDTLKIAHKVHIDFGDGFSIDLNFSANKKGNFNARHTYKNTHKNFTIKVTVHSKDGSTSNTVSIPVKFTKTHK